MNEEVLEDMLGGNGGQGTLVDGELQVHRSGHRRHTGSITPEGEREQARTWYDGEKLVKYALDLIKGTDMDVSDAEGLTKAGLVAYIDNHMKQISKAAYDKEERGEVTKGGAERLIERLENIRDAAKDKKSTPTYGVESVGSKRRSEPHGHERI